MTAAQAARRRERTCRINPLERLVTIELFGQPYTFRAESEMAQARAVADALVHQVKREKIRQTDREPGRPSRLAILISVALNIANENYELKSHHAETMEELKRRAQRLIHSLDACLQ